MKRKRVDKEKLEQFIWDLDRIDSKGNRGSGTLIKKV
jgi:hypothetical protein